MDDLFLTREQDAGVLTVQGYFTFSQFDNFRLEVIHRWALSEGTLSSHAFFCHPCCGKKPSGSVLHCDCKTFTWDSYFPIGIPSRLSRLTFFGGRPFAFEEEDHFIIATWLQGAHDFTPLEALLPAVEIAEYLHEAMTAASNLTPEDVKYELEL